MKITKVAETKINGYVEQLLKTNKRYYRIVRRGQGNMYEIYVNNSEYGQPEHDEEMLYRNRKVREWTIKECKESIEIYEMLNN